MLAHTLKGAGGNIGASELQEAAAVLEGWFKGGGKGLPEPAYGDFSRELGRVLGSLQALEEAKHPGLAAGGDKPASLPPELASGNKSGYTFTIVNCTKVTVNNTDRITSYQVNAVPETVGKSGDRGFCLDQFGTMKFDPAGGTNCTQPIQ